jgi:hypothetical protein
MATRVCALSAAFLGVRAGSLADAPWWAEFALAALVLLTMCLRIVFPQDSPDKLAWWRDHGRTCRRHRGRTMRDAGSKRRGQDAEDNRT